MLRLAAASLRLAFPLYLANLLLALAPAALFTGALATVAGDRPWAPALLGGNWLNQLVEVAAAAASPLERGADDRYLTAVVVGALGGLTVAAMLVAQWLAYTFLAGGILERLWATTEAGTHVAVPFWRGCRHWFWPFLGLGLVGALAFVVLGAAVVGITGPAERLLGPTAATLVGTMLLSAVNGWIELARADMVRQQYRSGPRALLRSARLLVIPSVFPRALGVWTLAAALGFLLLVLQAAAVRPTERVSWTTVVASLAAGQALAFLGAWLKVGRLAAALRLDRPATRTLPVEIEDPDPESTLLTPDAADSLAPPADVRPEVPAHPGPRPTVSS
ncbi:MAG: hypothetical protein M3O34_09360 [Chloroflexota bacterium]|nr:hypothetical protein [Chloroflexota bacterium]